MPRIDKIITTGYTVNRLELPVFISCPPSPNGKPKCDVTHRDQTQNADDIRMSSDTSSTRDKDNSQNIVPLIMVTGSEKAELQVSNKADPTSRPISPVPSLSSCDSKGSMDCVSPGSLSETSSSSSDKDCRSCRCTSCSSPTGELGPSIDTCNCDIDDLTCPICLDPLHRPRTLSCMHVFCLLCLQEYANTCRSAFTCPTCRQKVTLPPGGVINLPSSCDIKKSHQNLSKQASAAEATNAVEQSSPGQCQGSQELTDLRMETQQLLFQLGSAKEVLQLRFAEEHERCTRLRSRISLCYEEAVAELMGRKKKAEEEVEVMEKNSQEKLKSLSQEIDNLVISPSEVEGKCPDDMMQLHSRLHKLVEASSTLKGPWVFLNSTTLSIERMPQTLTDKGFNRRQVAVEGKRLDDLRSQGAQDRSLLYRRKSSFPRMRWSHHLMERPSGIALSPWNDLVYVTGSDSCKVFVYDLRGNKMFSFGTRGHKEGQFLCPIALAFSHTIQELYILDKWKNCIHVFHPSGTFLRQIGRKGKGLGQFSSPEGIATDAQGNIYVADTCNSRVQVLDKEGALLREVAVGSSQMVICGDKYMRRLFSEPTGIALSNDGRLLYVADAGNHRIWVYDLDSGELESMFGSHGINRGQLDSPEAIAIDSQGFILVGDSGNGRLQVLRPNGQFVRYFGTRSSHKGIFGWVGGLAVNKRGDIYVTDFKNSTISVF